MKKIVAMVLVIVSLFSCLIVTGCSDEESCGACGGSGYYKKRDCPFC